MLTALKREFEPDEIARDLWRDARRRGGRAAGRRSSKSPSRSTRASVIGRFSTFLEHVKPLQTGERVTRFNALFHWAVPPGREIEAGREVGRFHILTHCYWREGGPEFRNVNIMAVAHGTEKDAVLAHKARHRRRISTRSASRCRYTNVFWGGRSEIKPSRDLAVRVRRFLPSLGVDPETMKE